MITPIPFKKILLLVCTNAKCIISSSSNTPNIKPSNTIHSVTFEGGILKARAKQKNDARRHKIEDESLGVLHEDDLSVLDELVYGERNVLHDEKYIAYDSDCVNDVDTDTLNIDGAKLHDDIFYEHGDVFKNEEVFQQYSNDEMKANMRKRAALKGDGDNISINEKIDCLNDIPRKERNFPEKIDKQVNKTKKPDNMFTSNRMVSGKEMTSVHVTTINSKNDHAALLESRNSISIPPHDLIMKIDTNLGSNLKHKHEVSSYPQLWSSSSYTSSPRATANHKTAQAREIASNLIIEISRNLRSVINGKVAGHVPCDIYGESLHQEIVGWKTCYSLPGNSFPLSYDPEIILSIQLSRNSFPENISTQQKLYGGAQYHRTLRSFHHRIRSVPIPLSTSEEITQLMGGGGQTHNGVDILRSVSLLASGKMEVLADLLLDELAERVQYVLERMYSIVEYTTLVRPSRDTDICRKSSSDLERYHQGKKKMYNSATAEMETKMSPKEYDIFEKDLKQYIAKSFKKFVQSKVACAHKMAKDDIFALLKFVNWDWTFTNIVGVLKGTIDNIGHHELHDAPTSVSIKRRCEDICKKDVFIGEFNDNNVVEESEPEDTSDWVGGVLNKGNHHTLHTTVHACIKEKEDILATIARAIRSFDSPETSASRQSMTRMHFVINALVQQVTESWRDIISQTITVKFHSFCLLPFHEEFEAFLRTEVDKYFVG